MNGNTPYGGLPGVVGAGTRPDPVEVSPERRRSLSLSAARVAARTREFLPGDFLVGSEVSTGFDGPRATVAVRPPVGNTVSAGFTPDKDDLAGDPIPEEDVEEVAQGLAASAALQVRQAMPDDEFEPTAR